MNAARGFTLAEVLIAAGVLGAILVPLMVAFHFAIGGVGHDVRELLAIELAQEMMEQVAGINRAGGSLSALPSSDVQSTWMSSELDVENALAKNDQTGLPIAPSDSTAHRFARLFLSPTVPGMRRYLAIRQERMDRETQASTARVLWKVTVRVELAALTGAKTSPRSIELTSFVCQDRLPREVP